ncbi:MAG: CNNM domain-containing protein [Eubacterium sp.]
MNISASSIATTLAIDLFGNAGAGIATGVLTVLILIFGEISPKTMATIRAEKISLRYSTPIWILMKILTPVIFIINALANAVLRLLGVKASEKHRVLTESELRTIVDVGHETGVIETEEKEMINNVFDFGDAKAKEIMVPRIDMTFAQVDNTYEELLEIFRRDHFTRLPVYEESTDDVIGILNIKDLLLCDREHFSLRSLMRYYLLMNIKTQPNC